MHSCMDFQSNYIRCKTSDNIIRTFHKYHQFYYNTLININIALQLRNKGGKAVYVIINRRTETTVCYSNENNRLKSVGCASCGPECLDVCYFSCTQLTALPGTTASSRLICETYS